MKGQPKILIVEDHEDIAKVYKHWLGSTGAAIDSSMNKKDALEKIRCKTYDVALVDIMLLEDTADRGGVEVVKYIHQLNEGTAIIVVTGTHDIQVALDTYRTGIFEFIRKSQIGGADDILNPINRALASINITLYGSFSSLNAYLAQPELTNHWEDSIFRTLDISYDDMNDALETTFRKMLPLLRPLASRVSFTHHHTEKAVTGCFWSKGIGSAIWVCIANKNGAIKEPTSREKGDLLMDETRRKTRCIIWKNPGGMRSGFYESIWEIIKK